MNPVARLSPAQRCYLDFIRFVAAFFVLFGHAAEYFLEGARFNNGNIQAVGVLTFFLISGFLISTSAFQKSADPKYTFRSFFIDRFARIYSCFLPALMFVVVIDMVMLNSPQYPWGATYNLRTWIGNLFMLQDFPVFQALRRFGVDSTSFISSFGSARQFWTISIEWWIYMVFGSVLFLVLRGSRPKWAVWGFVAFAAIEPFYYFVGGVNECMSVLWVIGMGMSLFFLRLPRIMNSVPTMNAQHWSRGFLLLALFGMLCMAVRFVRITYVSELQFGVFLALALFGLLFALATAHVPAWFEKSIAWMANYSYSLYLTHLPILTLFVFWFPERRWDPMLLVSAIVASNVFAILFAYLFERHHRRLAKWLNGLGRRRPRVLEPIGKVSLPH
ncbi:MAG TPA: acyltransferase [Alphaproteobacteria bacterium]|jgi:peptidoglycan/LPS O-acetylase OafA/YrhL|nr:acyltransferase [Alphaproteobacteria bacterium]